MPDEDSFHLLTCLYQCFQVKTAVTIIDIKVETGIELWTSDSGLIVLTT